jgi:outer membrane protein OmpA-like peptidoglycan-associated protein
LPRADGTILVSEGRISITGSAASADDLALLEQYLSEQTGLPVTSYGVTITNLKPVSFALNAIGNTLTIGGALLSEEIQQGFLSAAIDAYGADNVLDTSTVDPAVAPKVWMYDPVQLITVISAYTDFRLGFDGPRIDSSFSGGPTFAPGSAELTPEFAQNLGFGIVALLSEPRMTVHIEGHTDSQGPEDTNLTLSQARADAVAAFYTGAGIDPARITAVGLGESEPIADNGTEEGRSRNRRIDLDFVIEDLG